MHYRFVRNIANCFPDISILTAKFNCNLFFLKVLLIFQSVYIIYIYICVCVELVHQSKYWYGVKIQEYVYILPTTLRKCFLSMCFYSTLQQENLTTKNNFKLPTTILLYWTSIVCSSKIKIVAHRLNICSLFL